MQAFASDRYRKYTRRLEERLCEPAVWRRLLRLSAAVQAYCGSRHTATVHLEPPETAAAPLARLALLCLEVRRRWRVEDEGFQREGKRRLESVKCQSVWWNDPS